MTDASIKTVLGKYYGWLWSGLGLLLLLGMLGLGLSMLDKADLRHDQQVSHINNIRVIANFEYVDINEIKAYLQPLLDKEFVELDLAQVEELLKQHPWVRQSTLQKKWPDTLIANVEEQVPVAILQTGGYLNSRAEVFDKANKIKVTDLPIIKSETQNYSQILKTYAKLDKVLLASQTITDIHYQSIGNYDFKLSNGTQVILGRRQIDKRIKDLLQVFEYLKEKKIDGKTIDMRYRNAVAVKWQKYNSVMKKEQI